MTRPSTPPAPPRRRDALPGRQTIAAVALPLLAISVAILVWHTHGYHIDLEVYRIGVQTWLAGGDMYGPLPPTISGMALPFIYPPFAAMLLAPFAFLPWTAAWVLLFALSLGSLAVTLYVAARQAWPDGGPGGALSVAALALPLLLWIEPVLETFEFGQVNLVLMGLVAVDCLAPRTRWPRGLLVGIAAAIKLTPAAFVLFFLLRRDARAAVVTVVTAAVATGIGFVVDAASSARYWFGGPASGVSGSVFYTNQTIQAVLARAEVPALAAKAVWLVATVALLVLIVPVVRRAEPALASGDRRRVRAAGEPDVVVAPLGVDRSGAARGRRGGGPAALPRLGGRRRGAGRDVLRRPVPLPAARDGPGASLDGRAAGGGGDVRDRRHPGAGGGAAHHDAPGPGAGRRHEVIRPAPG